MSSKRILSFFSLVLASIIFALFFNFGKTADYVGDLDISNHSDYSADSSYSKDEVEFYNELASIGYHNVDWPTNDDNSYYDIENNYPVVSSAVYNGYLDYADPNYFYNVRSEDWGYCFLFDGSICITTYFGSAEVLTVPAELDGFRVSSFVPHGYRSNLEEDINPDPNIIEYYNTSVKSLRISNGITIVGGCGFFKSLEQVYFPSSIQYIRPEAFKNCIKLSKIDMPDKAVRIGNNAFFATAWWKKQIEKKPNNVVEPIYINNILYSCKYISQYDDEAVNGYASFEESTYAIKPGTKSIADGAFAFHYPLFDNVSTLKIPGSVKIIGENAFRCGWESLKNIDLEYGTEVIYESAFEGCHSLASITIPKSVKAIYSQAFKIDDISKVEFLGNVDFLARYSFGGNGFNSMPIGSQLYANNTLLGVIGRDNNKWDNEIIIVSPNTRMIAKNAYPSSAYHGSDARCSLKIVEIPETVKTIECHAFAYQNSLETILLPDGLERIGDGAFIGTNLKEIVLPKSLTYLGNNAFQWTPIQSIVVPGSITSIFPYTFSDCEELKTALIEPGIYHIGPFAFYNCKSLESVFIPLTVNTLFASSFEQCDSLSDIYYEGTKAEWDLLMKRTVAWDGKSECFSNKVTVHYNSLPHQTNNESKEQRGILQKGDGWKLEWEVNYSEDENGNKSDAALKVFLSGDSSSLSHLHVEDNLGELASDAEQPWISKTGLKIKDFVKISVAGNKQTDLFLPNKMFKNYTKVSDVKLEHVAIVGESAFKNCNMLSNLSLDGSVEIIEESAFENTAIKEISLSTILTKIGDNAFSNCNRLKTTRYDGLRTEWNKIDIGENNDSLYDSLVCALIVYGYKYYDNLDYYSSHISSSAFDEELCKLMAGIAMSAYDRDLLRQTYSELGFSDWKTYNLGLGLFIDGLDLRTISVDSNLEYSIGKKQTKTGDTIILIDIRGTKTIEDWLRDGAVSKEKDDYSVHSGFRNASETVYKSLVEKIGDPATLNNTKIFVTGHSLGAAVSNLLSSKLSSEMGKQDVYCYDFACPDTVAFDNSKIGSINPFNTADAHNNIFNICNDEDIVAYVPGVIGSELLMDKNLFDIARKNTTYLWGKYGITKWFDDGKSSHLNGDAHRPESYFNNIVDSSQHYYDSYYHPEQVQEALLAIGSTSVVKSLPVLNGIVWTVALCPVDIRIVNDAGETVAYTEDGIPYYNNYDEDVFLMVSGDKKAVCYSETKNYSIKLRGTDTGEMTLITGKSNGDTIESIIAFENVILSSGKTMECDPVESSPKETKLYVTNNKNELAKEIHEDGTETKIGVTDLAIRSIIVERDEDDFKVKPGASKQIKVVFKNADGDIIEKDASWTSSNVQIATVSPTGLVTAVSEGSVTITVSVDDQSMDIPITVGKKADATTPSTPTPTPSENNEPVREDDRDSTDDITLLTGIVKGPDGKWAMYKDGKVDTSYTGIAKNKYGWWRVEKGYVNFKANGIYKNQYGWWKTTDGKVTFDETGVFKNEYGWWRVKDSKVDFKANGIYKNQYGWWKTTNGKVTFDETGVFKNEYGWWRVEKSKVNFKANGIYKNQYGWWKTTKGKVTFKENGVFKNEYGWWKVEKSKVNFKFTGIAKNKYGTWYVKNGKVDFNKTGKVQYKGKVYTVKEGKVQ